MAYCKSLMNTIVTEADCVCCPRAYKVQYNLPMCNFYVEEGDFKKIRCQCTDIQLLIYMISQIEALAWNGAYYKENVSQGIVDMIKGYRDEIKAINERS